MCDKESMIEKDKCSFGHGHRKVCFAVLPLWASTDWFIRLIESVRGWRVKGVGAPSDDSQIFIGSMYFKLWRTSSEVYFLLSACFFFREGAVNKEPCQIHFVMKPLSDENSDLLSFYDVHSSWLRTREYRHTWLEF